MKISYDRQANALYIRLVEGDHQKRVVQINPDVLLDFGAGEQLLGIEVLRAGTLFEQSEQPVIDFEGVTPRVES